MQKGFAPIFVLIAILIISGLVAGAYYLGIQKGRPVPQRSTPSPLSVEVIEPSPKTTVVELGTVSDITWKVQSITLQHESKFAGKKTILMELKIPEGWIFQTSSRKSDQDDLIKNCSDYIITSPIVGLSMTLSPICSGWAAKYTSFPPDAIIVFQEKRGGNAGPFNEYRIRYEASPNNYNYVDAVTNPNRPLDKSKDQVMDAITIGYAPPNESTGDFFFITAHLVVGYHPEAGEKNKYLSIADQIAASITLR